MDLDPATGRIKVDEARLEQILLNLVTNARDAMPDGGTIRIATRSITRGEPESESQDPIAPGDYVELSVADTGPGMSDEIRSRICEPFFTTKRPGAGTGLGLATVLGIVHQSGGFVQASSILGSGSTFRVLLPETQELETARRPDLPSPAASAARILLVEDESSVRAATRRLLESLGHQVIDAENGREALEALSQHPEAFDILISDVIMPDLTGPMLATEVWKQKPNVKVLFISGYPADQLPLSGGLPSQSEYLSKPFGRKELGAKLAEILGATA